jgi:hypothetical protein
VSKRRIRAGCTRTDSNLFMHPTSLEGGGGKQKRGARMHFERIKTTYSELKKSCFSVQFKYYN